MIKRQQPKRMKGEKETTTTNQCSLFVWKPCCCFLVQVWLSTMRPLRRRRRLSPFHVYTSQCLVDFLPMNIDKAVARKNNGEGWGGWWGGTDGQRKGKFQGTSRRSFNGLCKNFALCSLIKLIQNELHLILGTKNIFCSKHNYNIFLLHASIINNNASSLEDIHIVYCTYPTVKST